MKRVLTRCSSVWSVLDYRTDDFVLLFYSCTDSQIFVFIFLYNIFLTKKICSSETVEETSCETDWIFLIFEKNVSSVFHLLRDVNFYIFEKKKFTIVKVEVEIRALKWDQVVIWSFFTKLYQFKLSTIFHCHCNKHCNKSRIFSYFIISLFFLSQTLYNYFFFLY